MSLFYILNEDGTVRTTEDVREWAAQMEGRSRILRQDRMGDLFLSTVFLGLDHSFGGSVPLLWETMLFGPDERMMDRYATREEALKGHMEMLEIMKKMAKNENQDT